MNKLSKSGIPAGIEDDGSLNSSIFKSPEEIIAGKDEDVCVSGYVQVHVSDMIDNDYESFLDLITKKLVGDVLLSDISYEAVAVATGYPNDFVMLVSGYIEDTEGE